MLTQVQLNAFRETLERRFRELRGDIRQALLESNEQSYSELAGRVHDWNYAPSVLNIWLFSSNDRNNGLVLPPCSLRSPKSDNLLATGVHCRSQARPHRC